MDKNPFNPTDQPEPSDNNTDEISSSKPASEPSPEEVIQPAKEPLVPTEEPLVPAGSSSSAASSSSDTSKKFATENDIRSNPDFAAALNEEAEPAVEPVVTTKKSRRGLIVTLCLLVILLIGGGVAGMMYLNHRNSDPVVLMDAVTDALDIRAATLSSDIRLEFKDEYSDVKKIQLVSVDKTALIPSTSDAQLSITLADDTEFVLDVASVVLSDGVVYLKFDGVVDTWSGTNLPEEYDEAFSNIEGILEQVDGQWIRVSLSELMESEFGSDLMDIDIDQYDCMISAAKNLNTDSSRTDLIELYKANPFFEVEKKTDTKIGDYTDYQISHLRPELISFLNSAQDKPFFTEFLKCDEDIKKHTFTSGDFDTDEDVASSLIFGIDTAKRQLGRVIFTAQNDEYALDARIEVKERHQTLTVTAPADAVSLADLLQDIYDYLMGLNYIDVDPDYSYIYDL